MSTLVCVREELITREHWIPRDFANAMIAEVVTCRQRQDRLYCWIVLNTWESISLIILVVASSLGLLVVPHHTWPIEQRRLHNDLIGWNITVLGTTYAVIVGFMLYAVWTNLQVATGNAEAEANCLVNVVRTAQGLPADKRHQIQNLAAEYVQIMLVQEWAAMSSGNVSAASARITEQLWAAITGTETSTSSEQTARDHALTELSRMTDHRRLRQLEVNADLPGILWAVLILGAAATIVSACLFGSSDLRLHLTQVTALSFVISLLLVAIADLNRPFQGSVHVQPSAFERARDTLAATK
jgi:hypothetical protein